MKTVIGQKWTVLMVHNLRQEMSTSTQCPAAFRTDEATFMTQLRSKILFFLMFAYAICINAVAAEHVVGSRVVTQVFSQPKLADLARAACTGNESEFKRALFTGADPNGTGFEDVTPLYWAVSCQNLAGIELLLRSGATPNYKFGGHFSAVYAASTMKNSSILKLLLKYGGDPNSSNSKSNETALGKALTLGIHGDGWDNYYALLGAGADINSADEMGYTIAKKAAAFGSFDKVAELLERGYTYDLPDLGRTVQLRKLDPTSEQVFWQTKVKASLEERGVQFPVPPKVRR